MLRTNENETEILLGNKQLLGIFFVVAILLGVAFTGGYMVGRGSIEKKAAETTASANQNATAVETHAIPADSSPAEPAARESTSAPANSGSKSEAARDTNSGDSAAVPGAVFTPQKGQVFLQVAAVGPDEAQGIADVLRRKGFHANAAPKPGTAKVYRVLIGPIHGPGELSSTRDSLRKTGFRDVILQRY